MLTITDRELIPKIEEAIVARNDEGQVTNVVLTFERDAFVIRGTLQRALRTTIQVSGRLVMRNGRVEAEMVKGRIGFIAVPESYMAEATDEVNESLDTYFRTEYGIRVTSVEILPGELRLSRRTPALAAIRNVTLAPPACAPRFACFPSPGEFSGLLEGE